LAPQTDMRNFVQRSLNRVRKVDFRSEALWVHSGRLSLLVQFT